MILIGENLFLVWDVYRLQCVGDTSCQCRTGGLSGDRLDKLLLICLFCPWRVYLLDGGSWGFLDVAIGGWFGPGGFLLIEFILTIFIFIKLF
jgi:hypothetical protein